MAKDSLTSNPNLCPDCRGGQFIGDMPCERCGGSGEVEQPSKDQKCTCTWYANDLDCKVCYGERTPPVEQPSSNLVVRLREWARVPMYAMIGRQLTEAADEIERLTRENEELRSLAAGDHEDNARLRAALEWYAKIGSNSFSIRVFVQDGGAKARAALMPSTNPDG